jgi:hypothetical protein
MQNNNQSDAIPRNTENRFPPAILRGRHLSRFLGNLRHCLYVINVNEHAPRRNTKWYSVPDSKINGCSQTLVAFKSMSDHRQHVEEKLIVFVPSFYLKENLLNFRPSRISPESLPSWRLWNSPLKSNPWKFSSGVLSRFDEFTSFNSEQKHVWLFIFWPCFVWLPKLNEALGNRNSIKFSKNLPAFWPPFFIRPITRVRNLLKLPPGIRNRSKDRHDS